MLLALRLHPVLLAWQWWLSTVDHAKRIRLKALGYRGWRLIPLRECSPRSTTPGSVAFLPRLCCAWARQPRVEIAGPTPRFLLLLLAQYTLGHVRVQLPRILVLLSQFLLALQRGDIALAQRCDGLVPFRVRDAIAKEVGVAPFRKAVAEWVLGRFARPLTLVPSKIRAEVADSQRFAEEATLLRRCGGDHALHVRALPHGVMA